jgi:hypothetical protein
MVSVSRGKPSTALATRIGNAGLSVMSEPSTSKQNSTVAAVMWRDDCGQASRPDDNLAGSGESRRQGAANTPSRSSEAASMVWLVTVNADGFRDGAAGPLARLRP